MVRRYRRDIVKLENPTGKNMHMLLVSVSAFEKSINDD